MDYYNTVSEASDTVKQLSVLLDSAEGLLASPNWEQPMPGIFKLTNGVASEGKGVITHAFLLGLGLILCFFLAMLFLIRYGAKQFGGLRKERGSA